MGMGNGLGLALAWARVGMVRHGTACGGSGMAWVGEWQGMLWQFGQWQACGEWLGVGGVAMEPSCAFVLGL